jgi:hypothetical protein
MLALTQYQTAKERQTMSQLKIKKNIILQQYSGLFFQRLIFDKKIQMNSTIINSRQVASWEKLK